MNSGWIYQARLKRPSIPETHHSLAAPNCKECLSRLDKYVSSGRESAPRGPSRAESSLAQSMTCSLLTMSTSLYHCREIWQYHGAG